jgi:hypothetical protein
MNSLIPIPYRFGLPNLWIPRSNQFLHLETLPQLATGKMDLRSIRKLATQFSLDQDTEIKGACASESS